MAFHNIVNIYVRCGLDSSSTQLLCRPVLWAASLTNCIHFQNEREVFTKTFYTTIRNVETCGQDTCIRFLDVPGSNIGPEGANPDLRSSW